MISQEATKNLPQILFSFFLRFPKAISEGISEIRAGSSLGTIANECYMRILVKMVGGKNPKLFPLNFTERSEKLEGNCALP